MPKEVKHAYMWISETQLQRLVVVLQNALSTKGTVSARWVEDIRKIQVNAIDALIKINGGDKEEEEWNNG